jgi:hypothetical protein
MALSGSERISVIEQSKSFDKTIDTGAEPTGKLSLSGCIVLLAGFRSHGGTGFRGRHRYTQRTPLIYRR